MPAGAVRRPADRSRPRRRRWLSRAARCGPGADRSKTDASRAACRASYPAGEASHAACARPRRRPVAVASCALLRGRVFPRAPEQVTATWLGDVLGGGRLARMTPTVVGTGQMGTCVRYALDWDGADATAPRSVVCKFASNDP